MLIRISILVLCTIANFGFAEGLKVVLTGTSEIGQEIVETIHENGEELLVLGRDQNKLNTISQKYNCETFQIDFEDYDTIIKLGEYLSAQSPIITGFVIITPRPAFATEIMPSESSWHELFRVCYTRPLEVLKVSLPYFADNSQLVVLSGVTSVEASPEYASYGVLRKMWLAETKSLAWELGARGIKVNTVSPGLVMTSSHLRRWEDEANLRSMHTDALLLEKARSYPTQRITTKRDVAEAIYFFLSGQSNITGQNLVIDGGNSQVY